MKKHSGGTLQKDGVSLKDRLTELERTLEETRGELARIRERERLLDEAFTNMPLGLGIFDADNYLISFNQAFVETFPVLAAKGLIRPGIHFKEIVRAGAEAGLAQIGEQSIEEYVESREQMRKQPTLNAPRRYFHTNDQWIESIERRTQSGGYISVRTNVTEMREMQEQQMKAVAASHAKSIFLANMSHEIRTPMNGVIGMIELLQQTEITPDQESMLKTARDSAFGLLDIINDILDVSKIEAGKLELERAEVCIRDIVEGVVQTLLPNAIEKNVELRLYIEPGTPPRLLCDPVRLKQVLFNIIGNAVKFSSSKDDDETGLVTIRTDVVERESDKVQVRFTISDTGVGIDQKTLAGLFKPFTQADASTTRKFGGTGLGLTISKSLVDMMGGDINVESQVGQGSRFTITLPLEIGEGDGSDDGVVDLSEWRVLVATQAPFLRMALSAYLKHVNATVEIARSVEDVVREARQAAAQQRPFDAVILDSRDNSRRDELVRSMRADPLTASLQYVFFEKDRRATKGRVSPDTVVVEYKPLMLSSFLKSLGILAGSRTPTAAASDAACSGVGTEVPTVENAERSGQLILIAEDNAINQMVIARQLKVLGYAAEIAADGAEALRMMDERNYGLLLTDCHMPNLDGFGLTQAVREREQATGGRLPIIAITADALKGEAERCLAAGMDEYLAKPVELAALKDTLSKWLPASTAELAGAAGSAKARPSDDATPT